MSQTDTADGESGTEFKTVPQQPPRVCVERGDSEFPREVLREARRMAVGADSLEEIAPNGGVDSENVSVSTGLVRDVLVDVLYGRERVVAPVGVDVGTLQIESSVGLGDVMESGELSEDAGRAVVALELFVDFETGDVLDVHVLSDVVEQRASN